MIFPKIVSEKIIQVGDKLKLDASKTFVNGIDSIFNVEIRPEDTGEFLTIASDGDLKLEWVYTTPGLKTVSLRINNDDAAIITTQLSVLTEIEDKLFSNDSDIEALESDISYYYKDSRNSHLDMHREAQSYILDELYNRGLRDSEGGAITKDNILETDQLKAWSKYYTLFLIYNDHMKSPEDALAEKAAHYKQMALSASQDKQFLKLDTDLDGLSETVEARIGVVEVSRR